VTELGLRDQDNTRYKILGKSAPSWVDLDRDTITSRYERLAGLIPFFEWLLFLPPSFRKTAVSWLKLASGDRVLEIGCGTGRNIPFMQEAVGPAGQVYGVDFCPGMLRRARDLADARGWANVELVECDASDYVAPRPLDGALFGLSYNTMPNHLIVLRHAWSQLRSGGRLVIMDAKLPAGFGGRLILPFSVWLMKRTMLGNPLIRPWEDLARIAGKVEMEEFQFGSYYICRATKP
jgi:ubiquinone/menaquinone biosynthesis C-methylase UbiE